MPSFAERVGRLLARPLPLQDHKLGRLLPLLPLALVLELGAVGWVGVLAREPALDFVLYYWRARYALEFGWHGVYDRAREPLVWAHLPPNGHVPNNDPLPLLLLVVPLAVLPIFAAILVWQSACVAALVGSVRLIAPRGRFIFWLVALFGFWPVTWSLMLGQVVPLVCLVIAGTYVLLQRDREVAAGLLLTAIAIKPQLAFLVPLTLLAAGYWRAFAAWLIASGVLLGVCVALIGTSGVLDYAQNLASGVTSPATFHIDPHSMLTGWLGSGVVGRAAEVLVALAAIVATARWRGRGPARAIAAGTLGSVLASPFLHTQDLTVLFVGLGVFVAAHGDARPLITRFAYVSLLAPLLGAVALAFELAWLLVLVLAPPAPAGRRIETGERASRRELVAARG